MAEVKTDLSELGKAVGDAVAEGMARNLPRKVTVGEYMRRTTQGRPKLTRVCFQNGREMQPQSLTAEEIQLLNRITRPGRYLGNHIEVETKNEQGREILNLAYDNKTVDQRFELRGLFLNSIDLFQKILVEQEAALKEEEHLKRRSA